MFPSFGKDTPCECGDHANGITTYTVTGEGCCSSPIAANTVGFEYTYVQNEGVWTVDETTVVTGISAQKDCCPPT